MNLDRMRAMTQHVLEHPRAGTNRSFSFVNENEISRKLGKLGITLKLLSAPSVGVKKLKKENRSSRQTDLWTEIKGEIKGRSVELVKVVPM
jgi:hypothetical protein